MKLKLLRWLELGLDFFISTCITLLLLIVVNSIAKVVFKLNLLAVYNFDSNTLLSIVKSKESIWFNYYKADTFLLRIFTQVFVNNSSMRYQFAKPFSCYYKNNNIKRKYQDSDIPKNFHSKVYRLHIVFRHNF